MTRYRVCRDLQGGNFAMGRDYTIEQWKMQALDWCYMDEMYGVAEEIYNLPNDQVIDYISEFWCLEFRKVRKDKKKLENTDRENDKLEDYYKELFKE